MSSTDSPTNVLSAGALSHRMVANLPNDTPIKNTYDAVALAAHAVMQAIGFRLVGLGEDHKIEAHSDPQDPQPLPVEWNATKGSCAFRYAHTQSSMEFLIKVNRMGNKAVIMGMGLGDDRTHSFDLRVQDYVSDGNQRLCQAHAAEGGAEAHAKFAEGGSSGSQQPRQPAPGREADRPTRDPLREDRDPPARPYPLHDPLAHPRRPIPDPMPGFEDEFETQRGPRGTMPGTFPSIGHRDLYPQGLGPNDPLRGGVGPGFGGPMGGGGMHPTFDDPLFTGQGQRGGGYDPQAPPGSRYDPVGPGMGHPRGAGPGRRPPNPFGGFGGGDFI
ncbi:hypothetical protein LTR53_006079 [Teratosphaeriaceae sp. CCFEE 6253]|nr:hypothetical protein LTR53_006079 [Teratosphaeriaceae sp. CCFEE 6253]